jgi:hypothetical protein
VFRISGSFTSYRVLTMHSGRLKSQRVARAAAAVFGVSALLLTALAPAAMASGSSESKRGSYGQRVTVMQTKNLNPTGQRIVVRGQRFDPRVGIYVALCVIPERGQPPSPCGGGVNMQGTSGASAWISSNPPPYARSLVQPFNKRGFRTSITVSPRIGDIDCREVQCAVTVRADHFRSRDRSHDVIIPVSFR